MTFLFSQWPILLQYSVVITCCILFLKSDLLVDRLFLLKSRSESCVRNLFGSLAPGN